MGEVQRSSNIECNTPLFEPFGESNSCLYRDSYETHKCKLKRY